MGKTRVKIWGFERIELSPFYFNSLRLKYALDAISDVNGKILEVGCGAGAFARSIGDYRSDLKIVACDIDPKSIEIAKNFGGKITYTLGDIQKLPYKNNSFDAVLAFDVFEHLEKPEEAFLEIFRVLKKEGVFHCAIPVEGSFFTLHGLISKVGIIPKQKYAGHIQRFQPGEIAEMLEKAKFSKIRFNFSGHLFYQIYDFVYFFTLCLLGRAPSHTFEGYIETLSRGFWRNLLSCARTILSVTTYYESFLFKNIPGLICHFSAKKP